MKMSKMKLFIPLTKVDVVKRLVHGQVTAEVLDKSNEILDYQTSIPNFKSWSDEFKKATATTGQEQSLGNVRVMHTAKAAGKFVELNFDDAEKTISGVAYISDDEEWKKVQDGTYTGFSVGGEYAKRWADPGNVKAIRYTAQPSEVSLVDNPCVPTAHFSLVKADGVVEDRQFKAAPTNKVDPDVEQVWKSKDGTTHATKALALKKNAEIAQAAVDKEIDDAATAAAQPALDALAALDGELMKKEGKEPPAAIVLEKSTHADVGFLGDKAPRFAMTDPVQVVAAWCHFSKAANHKGYTPENVVAIKSAITKTAAAFKVELPDEATARVVELAKNLDTVSSFAYNIQTLKYQLDSWTAEQMWEGSPSPVTAKFRQNILDLCDTLKMMVEEETAEIAGPGEPMIMELAAKSKQAETLRKFAAKDSALAKALPPPPKKKDPAAAAPAADGTAPPADATATGDAGAAAETPPADKTATQPADGGSTAGNDGTTVKHSAEGQKLLQMAHDCMLKLGALCKAIATVEGLDDSALMADDGTGTADPNDPNAAAAVAVKMAKNHSKIVSMKLQKCHDMFKDMGAICKGYDAEQPQQQQATADQQPAPADDAEAMKMVKSVNTELAATKISLRKVTAEKGALEKTMGGMVIKVEAMAKRLAAIEALPAPPKGSVRSVTKSQDGEHRDSENGSLGGLDARGIESALSKMTKEERSAIMMKVALAHPILVQR